MALLVKHTQAALIPVLSGEVRRGNAMIVPCQQAGSCSQLVQRTQAALVPCQSGGMRRRDTPRICRGEGCCTFVLDEDSFEFAPDKSTSMSTI